MIMTERMSEEELIQIINQLSNPPTHHEAQNESVQENKFGNIEGTIQIVNNKIYVQNPVGEGTPPNLHAVSPVKIRLNGEFINNTTTVKSEDKIEWSVEDA